MSAVVRCGFCCKASHEVKILVAGSFGGNICDKCVELVVEVVDKKRAEARAKMAKVQPGG